MANVVNSIESSMLRNMNPSCIKQSTQYSINEKNHDILTYELMHTSIDNNGIGLMHKFKITAFGKNQSWRTYIFTNGVDESSIGHVSVYTQMMPSETDASSEINTWITMTFDNCKEISVSDYKMTPGEVCGVKRLKPIHRSNYITLRMSLIIIHEEEICPQNNYTEMLLNQKGDVTLRGNDWTYSAHRDVLSKGSPVFSATFQHDTSESKTGIIEINDIDGPVMKSMLLYLYSRNPNVERLNEQAEKLLVAADVYGIEDLKKVCETYICRTTTVNNVAERILMADRFKLQDLRDKCLQIVRLFPDVVMEKSGWSEVTLKLNFLAEYVKQQLIIDNK